MTDSTQPYRLKSKDAGRRSSRRKSNSSSNGNSPAHTPNGGDEMRNRVEALEKALPDIRERLVRVETTLDRIEGNTASKVELADLKMATQADIADLKMATKADIADLKMATTADIADLKMGTKAEMADLRMVTKSDIADLRVTMLEAFNHQTKWFIGTVVVLAGTAFAAARLMQ
ncbi:hypothetical protein [Pseudomonas sp. NA-150]|uniref:hypothetical protein n=1 Tax=Pseudomonas sp. NA-150 TaxID=3367525 RepID=UPI0037CB7524